MPVAVDYAWTWKSVKIRASQRGAGPLPRVLEESHIRIRLLWVNNASRTKKNKKLFLFLDAELILMEPHRPETGAEPLTINYRVCV